MTGLGIDNKNDTAQKSQLTDIINIAIPYYPKTGQCSLSGSGLESQRALLVSLSP